MPAGQEKTLEKQSGGMFAKALNIKRIRMPVVVLSLAKRASRTYVSHRSSNCGGQAVSSRLTAMDIEKQEFRRKLRGYDQEEVEMYLKSVAEEFERITLQNSELQEEVGRLRSLEKELRSRERLLQQTLVTAQGMSEEIKERARKESDLVVRDARMKSERMLQEAQDQLARLEEAIGRAKIEKDLFDKRLRCALEEHMSLLEHRGEQNGEMENVHVLHRATGSEVG
jgi:cell division initiation protein